MPPKSRFPVPAQKKCPQKRTQQRVTFLPHTMKTMERAPHLWRKISGCKPSIPFFPTLPSAAGCRSLWATASPEARKKKSLLSPTAPAAAARALSLKPLQRPSATTRPPCPSTRCRRTAPHAGVRQAARQTLRAVQRKQPQPPSGRSKGQTPHRRRYADRPASERRTV